MSATLLCLGCPEGLQVGVDTASWTVGPKFTGVGDVPPGLHFVHHGADSWRRTGTFVFVGAGDVTLLQWDSASEVLSCAETSEVAGHASLGRLSSGLGPYPRAETGAWPLLSDHISPAVLGRAGLAAGVVVQAENSCQPDAFESHPQDASSSGGASLRAPRFVTPRRRLPGMSAAEITAFNLNPSLQLSSALDKCGGDPDLLVGEFQLAFITLLLLSSVSALDHWKSIVHLIAACEVSPEWARVALGLVTSLAEQLRFADADLFTGGASDDFLSASLTVLVRKTCNYSASEALREAGGLLGSIVQTRLSVSLAHKDVDEGGEEDRPVVWTEQVPADGEGLELPEQDLASSGEERMSWMVSPG